MGRRVFFKKYFLLLSLLIGLILIAGFSLGVKKVRANYGSSICKFFCTGIVKIPPPPPPPEYTIRKVAMPYRGKAGDYGFSSGEVVRYVVTIKNNLPSPKYKEIFSDFEDASKGLAPFYYHQAQNWKIVKHFSSVECKDKTSQSSSTPNGCIGIKFDSNGTGILIIDHVAVGPNGADIEFDWASGDYAYAYFQFRKDTDSAPSSQFSLGDASTFSRNWSEGKFRTSVSGEGTYYFQWQIRLDSFTSGTSPFFLLDNIKISPKDAEGIPVGELEDSFPTYAGRKIFSFLPNYYPSREKDSEGKTSYDTLGEISYSNEKVAMWAEGPEGASNLNWKPLKLCSDFLSTQGYPAPVLNQEDAIAEKDPSVLCLYYRYNGGNYEDKLVIKNIKVPYPSSDNGNANTIYIVYSFKVL